MKLIFHENIEFKPPILDIRPYLYYSFLELNN